MILSSKKKGEMKPSNTIQVITAVALIVIVSVAIITRGNKLYDKIIEVSRVCTQLLEKCPPERIYFNHQQCVCLQ